MDQQGRRPRRVVVPRPDRLRSLNSTTFGWMSARVHRDGWLRAMPVEAVGVYAFLCLAANREGVSFYRRDRIGHELGLDDAAVSQALRRLIELDLVAYAPFGPHAADGFHQVLSVPCGGPPPAPWAQSLPELGRVP